MTTELIDRARDELVVALDAPPSVAPHAPRRRPAGPSPFYVGTWMVLASAALAYLALAATRPEALTDYASLARRGEATQVAATSVSPQPAQEAENQSLRETVQRLQTEVTRLSTNVIASEERAAQLSEKLASLQGKAGDGKTTTAESPAAALAGKFADAKPVEAKPTEAKRAVVAAAKPTAPEPAAPAAPAAAKDVKILNTQPATTTPAAAPIETGSIQAPTPAAVAAPAAPAAAAPITFGAPVVTPAPRNLGLQIASGASVDSLRLSWSLLSEKHADSLKSLEPRYVTGGDEGDQQSFDLVAGPIKSEAQAKKVCKTLQARGVACRIGNFEGNAL